MPFANFRPLNNEGKLTAGIQTYNPPAVETSLWALATVQRIADRLNWTPPQSLVDLVNQAATESDPAKQAELYRQYQVEMVDHAHLIMLFQPMFRAAVRNEIGNFPLTAAGWILDIPGVTKAG
jgi:peptide/nickel transport system substrate-binding protein